MIRMLITLLLLFSPTHEEENKVAKTPPEKIISLNVHEPRKEEKFELFTLTAYSNHFQSTGKNPTDKGFGITASGKKTVQGVTIAADWDVLPKGTVVWIDGVGKRVVQDTGSAIKGHKIDVYFDSQDAAMDFGRKKKVKVKTVKEIDRKVTQQHSDKPVSQEEWIRKIGQEVIELLIKKDSDYGSSFAEQYSDYGVLSGAIRMEDKLRRLKNLIKGNKPNVEESIEDTLLDSTGYNLLTLIEYRKEKVKNGQ